MPMRMGERKRYGAGRRRGRCLLALAALCAMPAARAEDGAPLFSLSGFGTLGAVYHQRDGVEFRRDISEPRGVKAHHLGFAPDSMLGVQLTARPAEQLEATVQAVSRQAIEVDYQPQISWAYVKYRPSEDLALRAGRLGIEMYLQGDSAEIGYSNLPIRQPIIFYPRSHDGVDAEFAHPLGAGVLRLKGAVGQTVGKLRSGNASAYDTGGRLWLALAEYTESGWTGRVSAGRLTVDDELAGTDYQRLVDALALAPNGADIVAAVSMRRRRTDFLSLAMAYDAGPLQGAAGISRMASDNWADRYAFYAYGGYRLGQWTPYALYALQRTERGIVQTGIPGGLSAATDALNQAAALAQGAVKINQSDLGLGVRYELSRNSTLKFQVDRIRYRDPESLVDAALLAQPYENRKYRELSLLSVALEFVF